MALLAGLMPAAVVVVERFADPPGAELFPVEQAALVRAVPARRREFATVRLCARAALRQLGVEPGPMVPGAHGEPRWPDGVIGSMTHTDGYRAAAVAHQADAASIGVDAEPHMPLPDGVLETIALPEEQDALDDLAATHPLVAWDRLLFSAKEAVYKAWFPLTGSWLDFEECAIAPDPERGTFTGMLRVPGPLVGGVRLDGFAGRWRVSGAHVVTAVLVACHPTDERGR
jgi:enterobactin synthetase component D / holo-[acyl-carrier protein] synthase